MYVILCLETNWLFVHKKIIQMKEENIADIHLFPELNITGYTCADLFGQERLTLKAMSAVHRLAMDVGDELVVVGFPVVFEGGWDG